MLAFLNPKIIATIALIACIIFGAKYIYNSGYEKAELKYQKMLTEFSLQAEKLRTQEEVIKTEVVTKYKDRVQTIKEIETQIITVTDTKLAEEAKLEVIIMNGKPILNFARCLNGEVFLGTVIS